MARPRVEGLPPHWWCDPCVLLCLAAAHIVASVLSPHGVFVLCNGVVVLYSPLEKWRFSLRRRSRLGLPPEPPDLKCARKITDFGQASEPRPGPPKCAKIMDFCQASAPRPGPPKYVKITDFGQALALRPSPPKSVMSTSKVLRFLQFLRRLRLQLLPLLHSLLATTEVLRAPPF